MRAIYQLCFLLMSLFLYTACIKDEALNNEADVEQVEIRNHPELFYYPQERIKQISSTQTEIVFTVRDTVNLANLRHLHIDFVLSAGARFLDTQPATWDFSQTNKHSFTIVSEDGKYQRKYTLTLQPTTALPTLFGFENYALEKNNQKYYEWWERNVSTGEEQRIWASGNAGFALSRWNAAPEEYPTSVKKKGYKGAAVRLCTQSTGTLGEMVGKPIAAGNLFLGEFVLENALVNSLAATRFGVSTNRKPLHFRAFYKWQPGENYRSPSGKEAPGADGKDLPRAYAILYKAKDQQGKDITLQGDNIQTHEAIVAKALVENFKVTGVKNTDAWEYFSVPFIYNQNISSQLLHNKGYKLAIVFSSSAGGDSFSGAVGSTLLIDECELIYE